MHKRFYHITSLLFLLLACEKAVDWNFESYNQNRLVVDAVITNEPITQEIVLSQTLDGLNSPPKPLSGAEVHVFDGEFMYFFQEDSIIPGRYISDDMQVVINSTYHLQVVLGSDTFNAFSEVVPVTVTDTFGLVFHEDTGLFRFQYFNSSQPSMSRLYYNWSADSSFCRSYGSCRAQENFYTLHNNDINALFSSDRQRLFFPGGTQIIRKKYSLTDNHQEYLRSLLMETEWSGGLFDVQHGNVPSNISNGGLGYFAASMVVVDTILAD